MSRIYACLSKQTYGDSLCFYSIHCAWSSEPCSWEAVPSLPTDTLVLHTPQSSAYLINRVTFSIIKKKKCNHHHHHISVMELGHLLTHPSLTYPEVSSEVYHDSFCPLGSSISLSWVIYFKAFYLHVVSGFSCIPVICPKLVLFLTPLQFVHLFCNLSKCKKKGV